MGADPDLIAKLRPVRLPPGFTAFDWHGGLAIFALALVAGLALAVLLRAFTVPRLSERSLAARQLDAARRLAPEARLLSQSQLVAALERSVRTKGRHGERAGRQLAEIRARIDAELYRPTPRLDADGLDAAILEALPGRGRR
ncbi:hypothetical protein E3C22_23190 [Jiella endophytica]|uniref:DUF4381 family protein n=1 Tax=Jiella endophytica TaxID=2558362 RepID=A0A4Y8RA63_9HYPH|nr:hypothetical protein [Jiella endophytica]TFF17756.1 hypothetical protein E3C22_23190 [Jiella endophytica]